MNECCRDYFEAYKAVSEKNRIVERQLRRLKKENENYHKAFEKINEIIWNNIQGENSK